MEIEKIYGDLPVLETERLILRKVTTEDMEDMHLYGSDEEVSKYVTWNTHETISDTKAFIDFVLNKYENKQVSPWGIEYKENGKFIGLSILFGGNQIIKLLKSDMLFLKIIGGKV